VQFTRSTRKQAESEVLRSKIWDLFLGDGARQGMNQYEIANQLGCSQQNVSKHVRACITRFEASNSTKVSQYLTSELKRINYFESKACQRLEWAEKAWKKSIGTVKVITKTGTPTQDGSGKTTILNPEVTVKEEEVVGDPRFMRAMAEADASIRFWHERRCKLLGLEAPKKLSLVDEREPVNMPDSELEQAVIRMAASLGKSLVLPTNGNGHGNGHNGNGHKLN
jgi:predicted XRE-type DNA-binding protein